MCWRILWINLVLRWGSSSARRGAMTVLGKVPKPINLPSQRLENHGLDPSVEIVPKGTLSWGSRSSSSTSNAWGSSTLSPRTDGGTGSPSHLSGRPSSGGSGTRPSTAGSDRAHEPTANAWGPNSRPSSASGALTSNQTSNQSLTSLRPRSAETRPGSSQLSRFAEPLSENPGPWSAAGTAEKLGRFVEHDFAENYVIDHGSHGRPGSSSGGIALPKERSRASIVGDVSVNANLKSGTANSWRRDNHPYSEEGVTASVEQWQQGDPQPYPNPSIPPQHYEAWHGPPVTNPPGYFRGPPGGPPFGAPVAPGGAPRGHHPKNGDLYRPHMPDAYIHPGMPMRPGFTWYSSQNAPEPGNSQKIWWIWFYWQNFGCRSVESGHPHDTRGPYKVLKQQNGWEKEGREKMGGGFVKTEEHTTGMTILPPVKGFSAGDKDLESTTNLQICRRSNHVQAEVVIVVKSTQCQEVDGWQKKSPQGMRESAAPVSDPTDYQAQEEEEERQRTQKARADAKLEELMNRRKQSMDGSTQKPEDASSGAIQNKQEMNLVPQISEGSTLRVEQSPVLSNEPPPEKSKSANKEPIVHNQSVSLQRDADSADVAHVNRAPHIHDGNASKQKRMSYKQKQNLLSEKNFDEKSISTRTDEAPKSHTDAAEKVTVSAGGLANEIALSCESSLPVSASAVAESPFIKERRITEVARTSTKWRHHHLCRLYKQINGNQKKKIIVSFC
uniref:BAT2 N-terminal domain-containing protein n=1 Tax=Fagus sylvatica TaxID=28930 RepID=A0A2N9GRC8_FAGSY